MYTCAECKQNGCIKRDKDSMPLNCPCQETDMESAIACYTEEMDETRNAALTESEGYGVLTRIEEIMLYAAKCGYQKLGLAFCIGLKSEAATCSKILRANGFSVESVCCKNGSIPKSAFGVTREQQVRPELEEEVACNPIGQAQLLEKSGCQLAILLGLCVGHDTLFIRSTDMPVTVLAAKDRVMGHNPLAAIYCANGYRKNLYTFMERYEEK